MLGLSDHPSGQNASCQNSAGKTKVADQCKYVIRLLIPFDLDGVMQFNISVLVEEAVLTPSQKNAYKENCDHFLGLIQALMPLHALYESK